MVLKVVLLRSNPVSPDPPVEKMADALLSQGYEVTILGWNRSSSISDKEKIMLEHGKANIIRFGIPAVFDGGLKKNLFPLAKFQIKLYQWLKKYNEKYDIIHSFDFDTGYVANKISRRYGKKLVYHILDFYVDSHHVPSNYLRLKVKQSENTIINCSEATIICSEKRREQIADSCPKKLVIIHNTPKFCGNIGCNVIKHSSNERYKIVYVGILAESRFLREIIDFVENDERFELHVGGFGIMEDEIASAAQKCNRIIFYGKLPYNKTLSLENSCNIMTAIYDPKVPNHRYAAPNKFYEALMLGKPIVMAKNTGFDEIIEENNIGCLIEYSKSGLKNGIYSLIDQKDDWSAMGERMKKLYLEEYSWTEMERRIVDLYTGLINEENYNSK